MSPALLIPVAGLALSLLPSLGTAKADTTWNDCDITMYWVYVSNSTGAGYQFSFSNFPSNFQIGSGQFDETGSSNTYGGNWNDTEQSYWYTNSGAILNEAVYTFQDKDNAGFGSLQSQSGYLTGSPRFSGNLGYFG